MYGYEPSWVDIYMNAMMNNQPMINPMAMYNTPVQPQINQPTSPIMVNNTNPNQQMDVTTPNAVDNSMSNLSDMTSKGVI